MKFRLISFVALSFYSLNGFAAPTVAQLSDHEASGTPGGACTTAGTVARNLTKVVDPSGLVTGTFPGTSFTLQKGLYRLYAIASASGVNSHQIRIYDTTTSTVVSNGSSGYSPPVAGGTQATTSYSVANDFYTVTGAPETFQILHYCGNSTGSPNELGVPASTGQDEVYTQIEIDQY